MLVKKNKEQIKDLFFHLNQWGRGKFLSILIGLYLFACTDAAVSQTIALWSFDEQIGLYPSCVINDLSENDYPLVIGQGGSIVEGKYGNALSTVAQPSITIPEGGSVRFGLEPLPIPDGRTVEPMTWMNANFCALMTGGENHLRNLFFQRHPADEVLHAQGHWPGCIKK